jgi:CRP-like cAMP-binding protein
MPDDRGPRARAGSAAFAVLRDLLCSTPGLKRVGLSWFLVNLAEWAYVTALAIDGYLTHGALAVGLIGARFAPAALIGSPLVGPASRRPPLLMLRTLSFARAMTVAAAAAMVALHARFGIVVALVWLDSVIAAPYRPVQAEILPALAATPRELSAVASSVPSNKALAQAAGALAGSLLLEQAGGSVAVLLAAVAVFLVATLLVAPLLPARTAPLMSPAVTGGETRGRSRWGTIGTGFELVAERARPLMTLGGARALTRGMWTALAVITSIRLLGTGSAGVGALMAAAGVGAAVSVPASRRLAGRTHLAGPAAIAYALAGIPILLVGLIARPEPALILIAVWGTAFALADAISNSLIHRVVDARLLAPSIGALEASKLLLEGLGALAAPALVAGLGIRDALIVAGALLPVLVAFSRRGLRAVDGLAVSRARPLAALRRTPSFDGLTMLPLESLAARLQRAAYAPGEVIVREGDVGDRFYLVDSGRVVVTIDKYWVAELGPGGSFGEKALLRAAPRSATVTAAEATAVWFLDAPEFLAAATGSERPVARLGQRPQRKDSKSLPEVLAGVPLFGAIDPRWLAASGHEISAPAGEEIIRQGEPGSSFYVLLAGRVSVRIDGREVRVMEPGDEFGEIALLHSVPRIATVTAVTDVRLWTLDRESFFAALDKARAAVDAGNGALAERAGMVI